MDLVHAVVVEPRVVVHIGQQHLGLDDLHIGQAGRLGHPVRDVDAEAVDAALQPEPQRLLQVVVDLAVLPVEVGLFGVEQMQIPLAEVAVGFGDAGPRRAAEDRHPVVGRMDAVGAGAVAEDVALPRVGAGARGQRGLKPRVRGAGVVGDQVHRHLDVARVGGLDQPVERRHAAEQRVDVTRVGHVVAVIGHRRHHHRVQPDGVDAERLEVIQPRRDAVEVADAVAVLIAERARIHLIEHRMRPPRPVVGRSHARNLHRNGVGSQNGELTMELAAISR